MDDHAVARALGADDEARRAEGPEADDRAGDAFEGDAHRREPTQWSRRDEERPRRRPAARVHEPAERSEAGRRKDDLRRTDAV